MNVAENTTPIKYSLTARVILIGILAGLVISVFDNVFIPFILPILFTLAIYFYLRNKPRVRNILLVALWARVFLSLLYYFYLSSHPSVILQPFKGIHFGLDGELYSGHAWWVSVLNTGKDIIKNNLMLVNGFFSETYIFEDYVLMGRYIPMNSYEVGFFAYLIAVIYSVFGYCPLLLNFINCVLGVLIGYFSYLIALELFGKKTAYITLIITLFFPTLFIWSAFTKLKEPAYIFLITAFVFLSIKFIQQRKFYYLGLNLIIMAFAELIRKRLINLLVPTFVASLFLAIPLNPKKRIKLVVALIILIKIFGLDTFLINELEKKANLLVLLHQGSVTSGGVVYKLLGDYAYKAGYNREDLTHKDYLVYYIKAMFHYFFEPFPSHAVSKTIFIFLLLQAFWILLLLFAITGFISNFNKIGSGHLMLLIYVFLMASSTAMGEGNIGTLVRHRDAITPAVIIFASAGIAGMFWPDEK